jgi:hypothetical protein
MDYELTHSTEIFDRPSSASQIRTEYLYNLITGKIPSMMRLRDPLEASKTLPYLNEHFTRFITELSHRSGSTAESGFMIGKKSGPYAGMILEVSETSGSRDYPGIAVSGGRAKPETETCYISAAYENVAQLRELIEALSKFKYVSPAKVYLLTAQHGEIALQPIDVDASPVDLEMNYGKGFNKTHEELVESLDNKVSGLYLFYGTPGTGKSSYIKYLLSGVVSRKVVYVPVSLVHSLTSPDFLPLLIENKNLVLVIEDAEKALVSREDDPSNSSVVSSILNLTDSFIGNALNVSIIGTFNTKKENIDSALLRKGRLKFSHEFSPLSVEDSQRLVDSLGINYSVTDPMTLAEIYYLNEDNHFQKKPEPRIVGFGN